MRADEARTIACILLAALFGTAGMVLILVDYFNIPHLAPKSAEEIRIQNFERSIVTDPITGCQYVQIDRGLSPRLDANGKPICGKAGS